MDRHHQGWTAHRARAGNLVTCARYTAHHLPMRIVIPGGSGRSGTLLARAFQADGHEVVVLSRSPRPAPSAGRVVALGRRDAGRLGGRDRRRRRRHQPGRPQRQLPLHAGQPRARSWTRASRSTRVVGEAIARAARPPRVWLQVSTATIYAHRYDAANDEATGISAAPSPACPDTWRFSIDVATAWERARARPRDAAHAQGRCCARR